MKSCPSFVVAVALIAMLGAPTLTHAQLPGEAPERIFATDIVETRIDLDVEALRYARARALAWSKLSNGNFEAYTACWGVKAEEASDLRKLAEGLNLFEAKLKQAEENIIAVRSREPADEAAAGAKADDLKEAFDAAYLLLTEFSKTELTLRVPKSIDVDSFRDLAADHTRLQKCSNVRSKLVALRAESRRASEADELSEKGTEEVRTDAHFDDLFRKSGAILGTLFAGGGVEKPGSPDRIVASVVSSLGAERHAEGTQAVFLLNLLSLFGQPDQNAGAYARHLFLRVGVPFSATTVGEASLDNTNTSSIGNQGGRISFVLGGSIVDDSDPQLVAHDDCYRVVELLAPLPEPFQPDVADDVVRNRRELYDICAKEAAYSQRLAWRVAAQLLTVPRDRNGDVKVEILGATFVYAPSPWTIISPFYRHIFYPRSLNEFGLGASLGANLGGGESGTNSWGRFEIDFTLAATHAELPGKDSFLLSFRAAPRFSFRLPSGVFASLALGPAFEASDPGGTLALLATASLSYDADRITAELLRPDTSP